MEKPLYHYLDSLWKRFPFPYRPYFKVEPFLGPIEKVTMGRCYLGRPLITVNAYLVGDTLVDTGLACMARRLGALCQQKGIKRALLTHHHEDHSGGGRHLQERGGTLLAGGLTAAIMKRGFPLQFYRHLGWGSAPTCEPQILGETTRLGPYEAQVISAPGHAFDMHVFYVPQEGWLFSGDVFVHERLKFFRRDEDIYQSIETLEKLLKLDFHHLICAHSPRKKEGKKSLRLKLEWYRELEGQVKDLHKKGLSPSEIADEMLPNRPMGMVYLSAGDFSTVNFVRSLLRGPQVCPHLLKIKRYYQSESKY